MKSDKPERLLNNKYLETQKKDVTRAKSATEKRGNWMQFSQISTMLSEQGQHLCSERNTVEQIARQLRAGPRRIIGVEEG